MEDAGGCVAYDESSVDSVLVDMCCYGMSATKDGVEGLTRKRTRIMSNAGEVLKRVQATCSNDSDSSKAKHAHILLDQGRAKRAQVYPREFCKRVCEGIAAQKRLYTLGLVAVPLLSMDDGADKSEALHEADGTTAFDDVSGEPLNIEKVRAARAEDMDYFRSMRVYERASEAECRAATGKGPIAVRWIDINKGDTVNPNYRSRLVAKEYKTEERPEWFAATPPSECLKLVLAKLASDKRLKLL